MNRCKRQSDSVRRITLLPRASSFSPLWSSLLYTDYSEEENDSQC
jgi:hypothetical protein